MATIGGIRTLDQELADAYKAIDVLEQRLPFVVSPDELGDTLLAAVELQNRVNAMVGRVGLAAQRNRTIALAGQRSVGQYVAARTNQPGTDIDRATRRARWLGDFDHFETEHGATLTDAHIDHLKKHCDTSYDTHRLLVRDQHDLIEAAANCSFADFANVVECWKNRADPDGKEPADQIDKTRLTIRKGVGGRGLLEGQCDAVTRHVLQTAIAREAEKLRRHDKHHGIDRTDTQRNMAALKNLVVRGDTATNGTNPGALGNIVMSQTVAEWALRQLAGTNDPQASQTVPVHHSDIDRRCELIDGTPIHPFLAVAALGLAGPGGIVAPATLRRYILDPDSRPLDVSVNARRFPEWMRTAIQIQSRGRCETHGCDCPHHWLQTDHVQPVAHGGQTRMDNGQAQCRPDNEAKGATPGHTAWRDRPPPPRHKPRPRRTHPCDNDSDDDDPF